MYGRKFMKRSMDREIRYRSESRDAIVWDIDLDERVCRVKIQGSNELVTAWFPENWQQSPVFIKKGNAVRIAHVGGERSRIEVVGWGLRIPTPVAGGIMPSLAAGGDYWISGGTLSTTGSMSLIIAAGEAYIAGQSYDFAFDELMGGDMVMGEGVLMGSGDGILHVDPPPPFAEVWWGDQARYRYDAFAVGVDGVVDYVKGEATTAAPVKPPIEGNHIIVGDYILIHSGMTEITNSDIGADFRPPSPSRLRMWFGGVWMDEGAEYEMPWHPNYYPPPDYLQTPFPTMLEIKVYMMDQYNNPIIRLGGGNYEFHMEFLGYMDGYGRWIDGTTNPQVCYSWISGNFVYVRQNADGNEGYPDDLSPSLLAYCDYGGYRYQSTARVVLLDESGTPMPPQLVL
jgi:hypothetical protein